MKFKFTKLLIVAVFAACFSMSMQAQVTIGSGIEPTRGALLDLKVNQSAGTVPSIDDDSNITSGKGDGGMLLPRVKLVNVKTLEPFIPADDPEFINDVNSLKEKLAGLIVYNLNSDDKKELYFGLNQWDGEKWNGLQNKATNALFNIECTSVQVMGQYGDNVALNSSNYIRVSVTVDRIGAYSISASFAPGNTLGDNGYFFELAGTFLTKGTFMLTIPGTGQPVRHTQGTNLPDPADDTPDRFILTSSGGGADCNFEVNVHSTAARPEFSIDCASTVVEGMYFEDQPLSSVPNPVNNQSHRIKVTLKNIPASAYGAVAALQTNEVDGFSFKGEAVLMSSTQEIYLEGTGTPRGLNDKIFTITSNSVTSSASCSATVYMLIPRKRLLTVGLDYPSYGYNLGQPTTRIDPTLGYTSGNDLLTDKNNFGYNQWSILKFAGFTNKGTASTANLVTDANTWVDDDRDIICMYTSGWHTMTGATLQGLLKGTNGHPKVDVVMIGHDTAEYFRNASQIDSDKADALIEFVKSGGILMICSEREISNGNFMKKLFNDPAIGSRIGAGAGSLYTLGFNPDNTPAEMRPYYCKDNDPILAGPFADIVGRVWGEDASSTVFLTGLPLEDIVIYSGARPIGATAQDATGVTVFRHREYPVIFVGDGGFNSNEIRNYMGITVCPFRLGNKVINGRTYTHYPVLRPSYGVPSATNVVNSIFTANAFAWCIMKAEEYRRNHK